LSSEEQKSRKQSLGIRTENMKTSFAMFHIYACIHGYIFNDDVINYKGYTAEREN